MTGGRQGASRMVERPGQLSTSRIRSRFVDLVIRNWNTILGAAAYPRRRGVDSLKTPITI